MKKQKQSTISNYQLAINKVLKYFSFFAYQPTLEEIHTFLPAKISKNELKMELEHLVKQKRIVKSSKYTLGEYSISSLSSRAKSRDLSKRNIISKKKLENWRFRTYIKLLSFFPQIKLVGLSGSIAMMNANENDDIDLFVITAKDRLFTGRFIAVVLSEILRIKRSRKSIPSFGRPHKDGTYKNKVCLNLFFDKSNLKVPKFKQTEFVGHEVLQMKPIVNKNYTYEKFLSANRWVLSFFPNAVGLISKIKYQRSKTSSKFKSLNFKLGFNICTLIFEIPASLFERVIKSLQLILINRHRTTEIITKNQLWFHPKDFEKKIKKLGRTTS